MQLLSFGLLGSSVAMIRRRLLLFFPAVNRVDDIVSAGLVVHFGIPFFSLVDWSPIKGSIHNEHFNNLEK